MLINGSTKILGIFGNPIKHSLSPAMHNAAIKILDLNYIYIPHPPKTLILGVGDIFIFVSLSSGEGRLDKLHLFINAFSK